MNQKKWNTLLDSYKKGKIPKSAVLDQLKQLPYEDLGFAKVDHHRSCRQGVPEVIFCQGKTIEQVAKIADRIIHAGNNLLATRANPDMYREIIKKYPKATYHDAARIITYTVSKPKKKKGNIVILCAGTSDIPVAEEAAVTAEALGNTVQRIYDVGVAGIHRLLGQQEILNQAKVNIVVAGMEGALPSVVAGLVESPVIAVPTSVGYGASFGGLSALLTMLNSCASGVAVVNIDNGFGAGYLANLMNR